MECLCLAVGKAVFTGQGWGLTGYRYINSVELHSIMAIAIGLILAILAGILVAASAVWATILLVPLILIFVV